MGLCICYTWCNTLMWFPTSCGLNRARPWGQDLVVSADSPFWPVLCQAGIMDGRELAGLTGNNSLPRGPTPFAGYNTTSQERVEVPGVGGPWSAHPYNPPIFSLSSHALQEARLSLAAQLPWVTSHYQNEVWGVTDQCRSQVQGQTKSHTLWMWQCRGGLG